VAHHDPADHDARGGRAGMCTTVVCRGHLAWTLWHRGYPDQAVESSRAALALARALDHPQSCALALYAMASLNHALRRPQVVRECAESLIALATEHGFAFWITYGSVLQGWAQAMQGQGDAGRALMRRSLDRLRATGGELPRTYFLGLLAEGWARAGRVEAALEVLAEAIEAAEARAERFWEPELHRLRGQLLWRRSRGEAGPAGRRDALEAQQSLRRAMALARRLRSRSFELRAAMSLAALWREIGRGRAGQALLAPIYRWFTEGRGTVDQRAARALLARLDR
jgi:predicted ATPase